MEKIKHPVLPGIYAGEEGRPCHGRYRWAGRAQRAEGSLIAQSKEIWKCACLHEAAATSRIQSVQPEYDNPVCVGFPSASISPDQSGRKQPEWPAYDCYKDKQQGRCKDEEGAEKGESSAGSDVSCN